MQQLPQSRILLFRDGLRSRRTINVCDRRKLFTKGRSHRRDKKHVRKSVLFPGPNIKNVSCRFLFNDRSKRAKGLAFLDQAVDSVTHRPITRVGEDTPAPQSARTKLHASLEPGDDLSFFNSSGDVLAQLFERFASRAV